MDRQESIAYLAGVFDGDGSIMIAKTSPGGRFKSPVYRLVIAMTSTNLEVLHFAQRHYGGRIGGPFARGESWRPSYRWELDGDDSLGFLRDVEPYIHTKREQIQVAFEFRERVLNLRTVSLGKGHGSKPMPDSEVEAREALYQRMRHLNQRGQP